jgi:hypothetical protein
MEESSHQITSKHSAEKLGLRGSSQKRINQFLYEMK